MSVRATIGDYIVDDASKPLLIAGPCVIESRDLTLEIAEAISSLPIIDRFHFVFKASYLKDNRSSAQSFRGPGLDEGLETLALVKERTGRPVLSDVHGVHEVAAAAQVLDVLQIPAFLCRQTSLLEAVGKSGRAVNVKKGQFLAPENMESVVGKLHEAGCTDVLLTERGSTFGYGNLVVDFRGLGVMRRLGHPVVFDATHSTQQPGALGTRSGGDRTQAPILARAAMAVGVDGLFLEVHEDPERALSDAATQLPLAGLGPLLETLAAFDRLRRERVGPSGSP